MLAEPELNNLLHRLRDCVKTFNRSNPNKLKIFIYYFVQFFSYINLVEWILSDKKIKLRIKE